MRILLTGASGQVGWELARTLSVLGEVISPERTALDLADKDSIVRCLRQARPQLVVNPAAFTAVDLAESKAEAAMAVNGVAPGVLAEEAKRLGAPLVHFSTDYVFDGTKRGAYDEADPPCPINAYGRTKLAGEAAVSAVGGPHVILRTSWVYSRRGKNFLLTMQRLARERRVLQVVDDQVGCPTWARTVAEATAHIARQLRTAPSGVYHLACAGQASWRQFAAAILGPEAVVQPIATADYPTAAQRPRNSVLACAKVERTFGLTMPRWQDALALCLTNGPAQ